MQASGLAGQEKCGIEAGRHSETEHASNEIMKESRADAEKYRITRYDPQSLRL